MHPSHVVAVVVQQRGDAVGVGRVEDQLLVQFPLDRGEVGIAAGAAAAGVDRVDVAADADRAQRVEPV
jgi:hypothetical protein